jgi:rfaE bifunctional protein kinase chain/domain
LKDVLKIIDRFADTKILVVGDFILDEFIFGEISRVSREAPVLILNYQKRTIVPGGGANATANIESLGGQATPLGFVGDDETAEQLLSAWSDRIETGYVFRNSGFQTTRKTRILAGSIHSFRQQVVRVDYERRCHLQEEHEERLMESLTRLLPEMDALILSDYSLGNLTPRVTELAIKLATEQNKPIVADSRDRPQDYAGVTSMTPNITEVEKSLSLQISQEPSQLEAVASRLLKEWRLQALLVTRGKLGMSLFTQDQNTHIPVFGTDEVADVTGAGDTVTATYTTALAAGASHEQAARLANHAAGLVVMKKGTATISQAELIQAVQSEW